MKKIFYISKSIPTLQAMKNISFEYSILTKKLILIENKDKNTYKNIVNNMFKLLNKDLTEDIIHIYRKGKISTRDRLTEDLHWHWEPWMFNKTTQPIILTIRLEEFLREHNVYTRFMKNVKKHYSEHMPNSIVYVNSISAGFRWDHSFEKWDYWNNIDIKFNTFLIKNNLIK